MALPCDGLDNIKRTDRDAEILRLQQLISFSPDEGPDGSQRILHLVGKSAVGKTFLLCHYKKFSLKNTRSVFLSFDEYAKKTDDEFFEDVMNSLASSMGFQVDNFLEKGKQDVSLWFATQLKISQNKGIVVFLLDEVSVLSYIQVQLLENYLLEGILSLPNIVLVLAGRRLVTGWKNFSLRPDENNVIELSNFDFQYTQEQIQALNPHIDNLVPEIYETSDGSPGNNKKIIEQLGDPPQFNVSNAIRACNQEFYEALTSVNDGLPESIASELLPALEALCVLEDFDKEYEMPVMLSVHPSLHGTWTVKRCSDLLNNLISKIQIGPGKLVDYDIKKSALAMEEQTRANLEKELKIRDMNLWKTFHCAAMNMYSGWAEQYGMDSIYVKKAEDHKRKLIEAGFDPETCG